MPVPQKRTTPKSEMTIEESSASSPLLPEQQEFHQHLRLLAQKAVRTVLELVMREELDAFIGVARGECSRPQHGLPQRKLYARFDHIDGPTRGSQGTSRSSRPIPHAGIRTRPSNETFATNPTSRDQPHPNVCRWNKYPTSVGEVAQTLLGVARSRQYHQSPEPIPRPAI
jgi:hypothetical protein